MSSVNSDSQSDIKQASERLMH